eukprot:COSAG03_NODE_20560_length_317_cov_0.788991_1_plen_56_part_01
MRPAAGSGQPTVGKNTVHPCTPTAYEVDRHRQLYEKAVLEALEDLRKIDNGVPAEV